jgi:hypothetical protein
MAFFKYFPSTMIDIYGDGTSFPMVDIFRAAAVLEDRVKDLSIYTSHQILDGARPDVVSQELYGESELHWTFFILNDLLRDGMKEWPLSEYSLDLLVKDIHEHYGSIELKAYEGAKGKDARLAINPGNVNLLYGLDIDSDFIALKDNNGHQFKLASYRSDRQQLGLRKGGIYEVNADGIDATQTYNPVFPPYFRLKSAENDNGAGGMCQAVLNEDNTINSFRIVDFGKNYRVKPEIVTDFTPDTEGTLIFRVPVNTYGLIPQRDWLTINSAGAGYIDAPRVEVQRAGNYEPTHIPYKINVDISEGGGFKVDGGVYEKDLIWPASFDKNVFGQLQLTGWSDAIDGAYVQVQHGSSNGVGDSYISDIKDSLYTGKTGEVPSLDGSLFDGNTVWIKKSSFEADSYTGDFAVDDDYYFINCNDNSSFPMYTLRRLTKEATNTTINNNYIQLTNSKIIAYTKNAYDAENLLHPGDNSIEWILPVQTFVQNKYVLETTGGYNDNPSSTLTNYWFNNKGSSGPTRFSIEGQTIGDVKSYMSRAGAGYIVNQVHSNIAITGDAIDVKIATIDVTSGTRVIEDIEWIEFTPHNPALLGTDAYLANSIAYDEWKAAYDAWIAKTQTNVVEDQQHEFYTVADVGEVEGETYQDSARAKYNDDQSYYDKYVTDNNRRENIQVVNPEYIRDFIRIFKEIIAENE